MPFTDMQYEYFEKANHRWNVKSGATRSGKTFMDYYMIPIRIRAVKGLAGAVLLLGNTKSTLQRNIIDPLQAMYGEQLVSSIKQDNTATLFGEKCYCLGADKITQVNRIRGMSVKYCYADEIATWCKEVFDMLKSRLDKPYSKFDGTCNPEGKNHWFKKFLDSDADIYLQKYTLFDNPYLTQEFVNALMTEYRGTVYYDRYILGEWVNAEGLVYSCFDESIHVKSADSFEFKDVYYVSCDYGTLNPTVFLLWHKTTTGIWFLEREYYYSGRENIKNKTDSEYADDLQKFIEDIKGFKGMIVDPSAASFITELMKRGIVVYKAKNAVLDGIRFTMKQLNNYQFYVSPECKKTIEEFGIYRWDETSEEDEVIKEDDHCMDAVRYFQYTILAKNKVQSRALC